MRINENFQNLGESYLFSTIARKVREFAQLHPERQIIRMGIGDCTLPLVPAVADAMSRAVAEMGDAATFRGYGDEQGYPFLREAIKEYYADKGVELGADEIFVGDGAKSDIGNILDLFAADNTVLVPDPVYPAYVDANIIAGRQICYISGNAENGFLPMPNPDYKADIIYLCSPNNPTGAVYTREQLKTWVDYAIDCDAIILFDAAYEIFVQDKDLPTSIFQIEGAEKCAVELASLSKTAGFTGVRCGYTVIPHALTRGGIAINKLWLRRQATKFNGVSYITQRGAQAAFSPQGMAQIKGSIGYYLVNATIIADTLDGLGYTYTGGKNAPYIWLKCPNDMPSWDFFDHLLEKSGIVGTPGAGFGKMGEGYFRLSAFSSLENTIEAMKRLG